MRRTAAVAAATLALLAPAAAAAGAPAPAPERSGASALSAPTATRAWVGRVLVPVTARTRPRMSARRVTVLQPFTPLAGGPTNVLVTAVRTLRAPGERERRTWVRVRLPIRPNTSQGWIPADALRFRATGLRILIDQSDRRLTLYSRGRVVLRTEVAIGEAITPTPNGHFAVAELIRTRQPGAFLGPVVMPLTGYSETLNEYAGGNGRVAIHGTSLPSLLGTRASHGCIRVANAKIVRIARLVRPGTPVHIRP